MISRFALQGDTVLLADPVEGSEVVSVGFWYLQGSRDEGAEEWGSAHFLEHMLFKGTSRRSALEIAQEIDRVGGVINAFTEKETVCVYATVPREYVELALEVISDMLFHSVIDPEEMERERSVIVNEIRSYLDSPDDCAYDSFFEGLWGDHPLARKITGEVEQIRQITHEKLLAYYRSKFLCGKLLVSIAGDFDPDPVRSALERHIETADLTPADQTPRQKPARHVERRLFRTKFKQDQIYAGTDFPAPMENPALVYSTLVLSTGFGESMSSRLFQELREKRGLCYSVGAFRSLFSDISVWAVYASTTPAQTPLLLEALDQEMRRLLDEPLTTQEVADSVAHLRGSLVLSKMDMESRMKRLVRLYTLFGRAMEYAESAALLSRVTREEVAEVADGLLRGRTLNVTAYGGKRVRNWKDLRFAY